MSDLERGFLSGFALAGVMVKNHPKHAIRYCYQLTLNAITYWQTDYMQGHELGLLRGYETAGL